MFEVLIPFMAIALVAFAAFAWVFLILLIISKLTKKDILEEAKPYKMFFCTGLLTIVALVINTQGEQIFWFFADLAPSLVTLLNPVSDILIIIAIQLVLSYIILLKFKFRKNEAAICAIAISILFNYYLIVFVAQNYTILIDKIFFPTVQSRYIPTIGNIGATNFQDDSYMVLESLIIIAPVFIAVLALFLKLSIHQIKDWNPINSKKFKEKLYLFAGIFIILILIFGYLGINTYNEQKQHYEDLITAEKEAEENAPTAFELVSKGLIIAINNGQYIADQERIKTESYEITSQELADKTGVDAKSILFVASNYSNSIMQVNNTTLTSLKNIKYLSSIIVCEETHPNLIEAEEIKSNNEWKPLEEIYMELIYEKLTGSISKIDDTSNYSLPDMYTDFSSCIDTNYCCIIFASPY